MKKRIIDAIVFSSMGVITLRLGYGMDSLLVLGGIQAGLVALAYYLLGLYQKEVSAVQEQQYGSVIAQLAAQQGVQQKGMEALKDELNRSSQSNSEQLNHWVSEYKAVVENQTQRIEIQTVDMKKQVHQYVASLQEEMVKQITIMNTVKHEIAKQACEQRSGMNRNIEQLFNKFDVVEQSFGVVTVLIKETTQLASEQRNQDTEKFEQLLRKISVIEEQCIELNGKLRSLIGIAESQQGMTEEIRDLQEDLKTQNRDHTEDLKKALKQSGEKAETLAESYKAHQDEFAERMLEITVNSENITNMLGDGYKVLHEIAASI